MVWYNPWTWGRGAVASETREVKQDTEKEIKHLREAQKLVEKIEFFLQKQLEGEQKSGTIALFGARNQSWASTLDDIDKAISFLNLAKKNNDRIKSIIKDFMSLFVAKVEMRQVNQFIKNLADEYTAISNKLSEVRNSCSNNKRLQARVNAEKKSGKKWHRWDDLKKTKPVFDEFRTEQLFNQVHAIRTQDVPNLIEKVKKILAREQD